MPIMNDEIGRAMNREVNLASSPGYCYYFKSRNIGWVTFQMCLEDARKAADKFFLPREYELVCILEIGDGVLFDTSD